MNRRDVENVVAVVVRVPSGGPRKGESVKSGRPSPRVECSCIIVIYTLTMTSIFSAASADPRGSEIETCILR